MKNIKKSLFLGLMLVGISGVTHARQGPAYTDRRFDVAVCVLSVAELRPLVEAALGDDTTSLSRFRSLETMLTLKMQGVSDVIEIPQLITLLEVVDQKIRFLRLMDAGRAG